VITREEAVRIVRTRFRSENTEIGDNVLEDDDWYDFPYRWTGPGRMAPFGMPMGVLVSKRDGSAKVVHSHPGDEGFDIHFRIYDAIHPTEETDEEDEGLDLSDLEPIPVDYY
jgi:hypothetical protein